MGFFGFGKNKTTSNGPTFTFFDGRTTTPEEYGYVAVKTCCRQANGYIDEWFGVNTLGYDLGLAKAIERVRFGADIYTAMLYAGIYLYHAICNLHVDEIVVERIKKGFDDCLGDLIAPNGQKLDASFKIHLRQLAFSFINVLNQDVQEGADADPASYNIKSAPSTNALLDIIIKANSEGVSASTIQEWKNEINTSPSGWWLRRSIDDTTMAAMVVMIRDGKITYTP
jgi:hypothetical protein